MQKPKPKLSFKEIKIYTSKVGELKVQCKKCGHKEIFPYNIDRKLCTYCGNYIYKNEQAEFKYKIRSVMKK